MKCALIIGLVIGVVSAVNFPKEHCLFYYTFDQTSIIGAPQNLLKDQSGNRFDISYTAAPILTNDHQNMPQSAVSMDSSYYFTRTVSDSQLSAMIKGDWSMGISFQTTANSGSMTARLDIIGIGDPYNAGFFLTLHNNRIRVFLGNHGYYDSPETLNNGKWHTATVVFSQGAVLLYIDGILVDKGAFTESLSTTNYPLIIGKHGTKNESFFKGQLDDAFFYNKALSADEVITLYRIVCGIPLALITPSDTFSSSIKPFFQWCSMKNICAYAIEMDTNIFFTNPFLSFPVEDTSYTASNIFPRGTYYVRIGANFDDKSSFIWINPHTFIVK